MLPLQKQVTGFELVGTVHRLLPTPMEPYALGANALPSPVALQIPSRLTSALERMNRGTVRHLTRAMLGRLSLVRVVPPSVAQALPGRLMPSIPIATLGPVPTKDPVV